MRIQPELWYNDEIMSAHKLASLLAILCGLCLAFGVGYASYPLVNSLGKPATAEALATSADPENMDIYWQAWHILERDFYGPKPIGVKRIYGAIQGLVNAYDDPYTVFVEPQPHELDTDNLRGSFGGIGAQIERTTDGFVLHPIPDQPADQAGVLDNDLILLIDDKEVTPEMSDNEVEALVRGEVGTKVALVVRRQGDTPGSATELTIHVVLTEIQTASVEWRLLDDDVDTAQIGYIKHTIFSERSPAEMQRAIQELKAAGAKEFIWDLRGNPGGLVDSAVQTADLWLDGGLVLIEERADGTEKRFEAARGDESKKAPLVVIVDGASASASEIVAGAMQDNVRATLVGVKTFGKGSVQLVHELNDQSSLHVTNAQWFTPNRHQISGQGLTPDVIVQPEEDPLAQAIAELQK